MTDLSRIGPKRLTGGGPAPSIGFLVDYLEDSRYHWQILRGAIREAHDRGAHLLCFVGGTLAAEGQSGESNWVFDLARQKNVDALVVLSGSLGNAAGSEGLSAFCSRFRPLPICSIAIPLPNEVSSVCVDNESGMRALIEHLIRVHNHTRIAFVRGPAANDEAELRLRVYRQVLEAHRIPFAQELVVPGDFTTPAGLDAVTTLFDERGLSPASLHSIVASNDVMALGVIEGLRARDIRVPEQIAVVGFDDIEESRFALPSLTTVGQRLEDQGREAVRIVLDQLRNGARPEQAMRHTVLVVRRSCGCISGQATRRSSAPPAAALSFDAALIRRRQHILADVARAARGLLGPAGLQWDVRLLNALAEQVRGDAPDAFARTYDDILRRLVTAGSDLSICNDVLSALRSRIVRCSGDLNQRTQIENVFHEARIMTTLAIEGVQVGRRLRAWVDARGLMEAGASILSARTLEELGRAVKANLAPAGIPRCFVARLRPDARHGMQGRIVLAERPDARKSDTTVTAPYAANELLRQTVLQGTDERAYAVFPTQLAGGDRGIVVLEFGTIEGYGYETLRRIFNSSLARMLDDRVDPVA
jgi:DNA-binding LacI/PurR family transcriptional regulator